MCGEFQIVEMHSRQRPRAQGEVDAFLGQIGDGVVQAELEPDLWMKPRELRQKRRPTNSFLARNHYGRHRRNLAAVRSM